MNKTGHICVLLLSVTTIVYSHRVFADVYHAVTCWNCHGAHYDWPTNSPSGGGGGDGNITPDPTNTPPDRVVAPATNAPPWTPQLPYVPVIGNDYPTNVVEQTDSPTNTTTKTENADPDKGNSHTRDPVNVITGWTVDSARDIALRHPRIPIIWRRRYVSGRTAAWSSLGNGWRHSFDWRLGLDTNGVLSVSTPEGDLHRFAATTASNRWITVSDVVWELNFDGTTFRLSVPPAKIFSFSTNGVLTAIDDGRGGLLSLSYSDDLLSEIYHSANHWLRFGHAGGRIVSAMTPSASYRTDYAYDTSGNLTNAAVSCSGSVSMRSYAHSAFGMAERINPVDETAYYAYDAQGRCTNVAFGAGWYVHSISYPTNGTTLVAYFSNGRALGERYVHAAGKILSRAVGTNLATRTEHAYDTREVGGHGGPLTEIVSRVEEDGTATAFNRRTWNYDAHFNPTNATMAFGTVAPSAVGTIFWDASLNMVTAAVDAAGWRTDLAYSTKGLPLWRSVDIGDGSKLAEEWRYTNDWLLAEAISTRGGGTRFLRDAEGSITNATLPDGTAWAFRWDSPGRIASVSRLGARQISIAIGTDDAGRALLNSYSDGTSEAYAYDLLGRLTNSVNRMGVRTSREYAVEDKISAVRTWYPDDGTNAAASVEIGYDRLGHRTSISNRRGGKFECRVLDDQGRTAAITNAEGQVATFDYLVGKRLASVTRFDGTEVAFAYDAHGNLLETAWPDTTVRTDRLANGAPAAVSCGGVTNSYAYDGAGRVVAATNSFGGIAYAWATNLAWRTRASAIGVETKSYDLAERLSAVVDERGGGYAISYDVGNAKLATVEFPNGLVAAYDYEGSDRPTSITWSKDGETVRSFSYGYTNFSEIASVVREDGTETRYAYDGLRRLASERVFDASGALVRGAAYAHDLDANRRWKLAGIGGKAGVAYDTATGDILRGWPRINASVDAIGDWMGNLFHAEEVEK